MGMMDLDLSGKSALVCGSTQGIGLAAAQALAELGARVVLLARDKARLEAACDGLPRPRSQEHRFAQADFADPLQVRRAAEEVVQACQGVAILVNNTGGPPAGILREAELRALEAAFHSHVIGNHVLMQAVVPGMKQAGYGRIVNIISTSVKQPIAGLGVSNTIRGAVASWAKTLAAELGPFGITVNNVLPGFTDTARLRSLIASKAQQAGRSTEEVAAAMRDEVPLGRFADPLEVGAAVAFLATPVAGYINGINLPVDGGRTQCL